MMFNNQKSAQYCMLYALFATTTNGFVTKNPVNVQRIHQTNPNRIIKSNPTVLHLEDWVADLIDGELFRQEHKAEFDKQLMEQSRELMLAAVKKELASTELNTSLMFVNSDDLRQKVKDKKMALNDPQRYCADRCVATGNCDIFEEFFQFSPEEVLEFCNECVLSEENDECEIPETFYGDEEINKATP